MPQVTFDAATAWLYDRRPGSSHHRAYIDGDGSICLWCQGKSPRGGVAVNLKAIEWLSRLATASQVKECHHCPIPPL